MRVPSTLQEVMPVSHHHQSQREQMAKSQQEQIEPQEKRSSYAQDRDHEQENLPFTSSQWQINVANPSHYSGEENLHRVVLESNETLNHMLSQPNFSDADAIRNSSEGKKYQYNTTPLSLSVNTSMGSILHTSHGPDNHDGHNGKQHPVLTNAEVGTATLNTDSVGKQHDTPPTVRMEQQRTLFGVGISVINATQNQPTTSVNTGDEEDAASKFLRDETEEAIAFQQRLARHLSTLHDRLSPLNSDVATSTPSRPSS